MATSSHAQAQARGGARCHEQPVSQLLDNWPRLGCASEHGEGIAVRADNKELVSVAPSRRPGECAPLGNPRTRGNIVKRFDVTFASSHGLCQDGDGNLWAVDSGPFAETAGVTGVKGNQVFKFDQNGKLLLTLGKAGVSRPVRTRSCNRPPVTPRPMATS